MSPSEGIFKDLVVIELASVLAGPSVGQFFAEMGAKVIKIENVTAGGDVTRSWKLPSEDPTTTVSAYFAAANWGKESVCVNLTSAEVQQAVYTMLAKADVVLTSYKPGDAEKLKMDYKTVSARNPKLIYGHITGYGADSPRAGYDAVLQAEAGFMYLNGEKGGAPLKMPVALIDLLAAHQLKEGLLAALYVRERTGKGTYVEVSLLRTAISSLANQATNYLVAGQSPERLGSEHPNIVPYGTVFTSKDDKDLVLAIGDDRQFKALCTVLGIPEVAEQAEYATNYHRVKHREALTKILKDTLSQYHRQELLTTLTTHHVPAGAVYSIPEALAQPLAQPQMIAADGLRGLRQIAFQAEGHGVCNLSGPPRLGVDTWQVLADYGGLNQSELAQLAENQVIAPQFPSKE